MGDFGVFLTKGIDEVKPSAYKNFSCNVEELDSYLKRFAKTNHKKNIGKTFVLLDEGAVRGFYTISMASIEFQRLPANAMGSIPKYPIPVARLGRLAVDNTMQRKKIGSVLLIDALHRISEASKLVAAYAIVVDVKNDIAKKFYGHFGFVSYQDEPVAMYLPISTVDVLLSKE
jgi:predicted N-acetyltransferase YhbS